LINRIILICFVWAMTAGIAGAQNPEDELGNWLIYNGTVKFSDRWSMFTEAQVRLWEVASNVNEVFVRAAGQYHTSPNTLVAVGYMHSWVDPFETAPESTENRIYEQFTGKHHWGRPLFEHRFRLEQRWIEAAGTTDYKNRFRYRLQITTPLNRPTLQPRTHFVNIYDEVMLDFANSHNNGFDQNRLYAAYGWQFTEHANLQLGLLWQAKPREDFYRLQIFYTHNFDLSDR
jgi:hypothetical protein